ncbi:MULTISPECIES: hypothetical protein [Streptomyces]|uniref:SH3b domain-containing protein n=1 Tax=Streptomyces morookaense TaxID=1970 RepID=A0A7Y7AZD9_STRMO|nr:MULTISPECIES: hypothetical protein [Streptomyces]MCC2276883.1 hypothetical protein [Streptomyces sp. ET3-23]NVK76178.1 hypothetical protein [Streptomyces morookaense]GHF37924.1 hypothetical protein GCM10010359_45800 [Streptomyces morookaense]
MGVTLALCATAGGAAFAIAADGHNSRVPGMVVSRTGQYVRNGSTTTSKVIDTRGPGDGVLIACKLQGESVQGNRYWYRLAESQNGWMSAHYVKSYGAVPLCRPAGTVGGVYKGTAGQGHKGQGHGKPVAPAKPAAPVKPAGPMKPGGPPRPLAPKGNGAVAPSRPPKANPSVPVKPAAPPRPSAPVAPAAPKTDQSRPPGTVPAAPSRPPKR